MSLLTFASGFVLASETTHWWDYPGFELWKFINLAIFAGALIFVLVRKARLGDAFRARREGIKDELERARKERDAAMAKLKEVEERIARLDDEVTSIKERTKAEAAAERERLVRSTEEEISKLQTQAQREIENAGKLAKNELRRFTAEQSIRMAEDLIKRDLRPDDDARLLARNIQEIGGAGR